MSLNTIPISEKIKQLRKRLNLTQEEFARDYDLPIGTIRNWEQSRRIKFDAATRLLISMIEKDPEGMREIVVSVSQEK